MRPQDAMMAGVARCWGPKQAQQVAGVANRRSPLQVMPALVVPVWLGLLVWLRVATSGARTGCVVGRMREAC